MLEPRGGGELCLLGLVRVADWRYVGNRDVPIHRPAPE
jgi:hypothetical protein